MRADGEHHPFHNSLSTINHACVMSSFPLNCTVHYIYMKGVIRRPIVITHSHVMCDERDDDRGCYILKLKKRNGVTVAHLHDCIIGSLFD